MDLFIGNLPADGTLVELQDLVGKHVIHTRFERKMGCDRFDRNYHFFILSTESDEEGLALIERLNGSTFHGNELVVRRFIQRSGTTAPAPEWDGTERRINPEEAE